MLGPVSNPSGTKSRGSIVYTWMFLCFLNFFLLFGQAYLHLRAVKIPQHLRQRLISAVAWKKNASAIHQWVVASSHPNGTRGSKSLAPDCVPQRKKKNAVVTGAVCTGVAHMSCSYCGQPHEASVSSGTDLTPLKTADRQTREATWPSAGGVCRLKLRISWCLQYPFCLFVSWLLFIKRQSE